MYKFMYMHSHTMQLLPIVCVRMRTSGMPTYIHAVLPTSPMHLIRLPPISSGFVASNLILHTSPMHLIRSTYPNPEFEFLDNICGRFLKLYKESLQNRKKVRIWGGILVWRRRDVETFAWCKSTPWRREVWGQYSVVRREVNGPTAVGALH